MQKAVRSCDEVRQEIKDNAEEARDGLGGSHLYIQMQ